MFKRLSVSVVLALCLLLAGGSVHAGNFFVSPKVSTLGFGGDIGYSFNPYITARFNANYFKYSSSRKFEEINYSIDPTLTTIGAMLDWHAFGGGFRLSKGLYYNDNRVDMTGRLSPNVSYEIGGRTYTGDQIGQLKGKIDVNDVTPYLGLGWGTNFGVDRNWFFTFDLGVLYHGSPSISLKAENPLNLDILNEDIRREIRDIESDVKNYRWYPVVALGFTYRF